MKGIVLAGGNGRRLDPITNVTNKHLLPVYDKPMIYYPLGTLINSGIKDIMIVCGSEHADKFSRLLGMGDQFGCKFSYAFQDNAGGIAQALALAEDFANGDDIAVILGDNIFEDNFTEEISAFGNAEMEVGSDKGAMVFLKEIDDPGRFGVAEMKNGRIIGIEEKPEVPKTNLAVTGFYIYDNQVFNIISGLSPSQRGEYEITDVNNFYIQRNALRASVVKGEWTDAGTFESLYNANRVARTLSLSSKMSPDRIGLSINE